MPKTFTLAACLLVAGGAYAFQPVPGSGPRQAAVATAQPANVAVITRGMLNSLDADGRRFVMNGTTYAYDDQTRFVREEKGGRMTKVPAAELRPGKQVTVTMVGIQPGVRIVEVAQ